MIIGLFHGTSGYKWRDLRNFTSVPPHFLQNSNFFLVNGRTKIDEIVLDEEEGTILKSSFGGLVLSFLSQISINWNSSMWRYRKNCFSSENFRLATTTDDSVNIIIAVLESFKAEFLKLYIVFFLRKPMIVVVDSNLLSLSSSLIPFPKSMQWYSKWTLDHSRVVLICLWHNSKGLNSQPNRVLLIY
jgi:hypothetical protein